MTAKLYQGKTGYVMNSIYADHENARIQALMEAIDDSNRYVTPENSKGSGPWALTVEPTEALNIWAWTKTTGNTSELVNKMIYYFPGVSHDKLFSIMDFESRAEWDAETKFNVLEQTKEYDLVHQLMGKIPFYTQRDTCYHSMLRKSLFV